MRCFCGTDVFIIDFNLQDKAIAEEQIKLITRQRQKIFHLQKVNCSFFLGRFFLLSFLIGEFCTDFS